MKILRLRLSSLFLLCLAIGFLGLTSPRIFAFAQGNGLVYISPPTASLQSVGTSFTSDVQVAGMDPFNGWDILFRFNSTVVNATSFTITNNMFDVNYSGTPPIEAYHCINGVGNPHCSTDGMGSVHSSVVYPGPLRQPGTSDGTLFFITFKVADSFTYSPIHFQSVIITNPSPVPTSPPQDGTYGIPPGQGFKVVPSPKAASMLIGSKVMVTLNVSSFGGYSGTVNITLSVPQSGLVLYLNTSSVQVSSGQSSYVNLTIVSDPAYNQATKYTVTITATSSGFPQTPNVSITTLERPDFSMGVSPSLLKVHATNSGSSTITLIGDPGFSGMIHLAMAVPPIPGLIASLGATDLRVSYGNPGTVVFAVRTPASDVPFKYLINITASSPSASTHDPFPITVRSPSPDFTFQIGASSYVVQAGQVRTFTLNASSVDYFKGQLFLLASSLSGIREVFSRPSIALDLGNSSVSLMTITTDSFLAPGSHEINVTALGTYFLGTPVNHSIIVTVTIIGGPVARTILGLQPVAYFGVMSAFWLGLIGVAIREIRKEKPKRFLD